MSRSHHSIVILSAAKDLGVADATTAEILRSAQDDTQCLSHSQKQSIALAMQRDQKARRHTISIIRTASSIAAGALLIWMCACQQTSETDWAKDIRPQVKQTFDSAKLRKTPEQQRCLDAVDREGHLEDRYLDLQEVAYALRKDKKSIPVDHWSTMGRIDAQLQEAKAETDRLCPVGLFPPNRYKK